MTVLVYSRHLRGGPCCWSGVKKFLERHGLPKNGFIVGIPASVMMATGEALAIDAAKRAIDETGGD